MAVEPILIEGADTTRGRSISIWGRCPWRAMEEGTTPGCVFFDDFMSCNITPATTEGNFTFGNGYAQFSSTGGTITNDTTELGGAVAIGSDGDDEGCSFRTLVTPFKLIQTGKRFWFEARIATSTIADTKHGFFIGLMENVALTATVPIAAAGTLADKNFVGFHRLEGDGDMLDTVYKADGVTQVTVQADAVTLVAATYIKVGMKYEPSGDKDGAYCLSFYQNGTRLSSSKLLPSAAGTDFPNDINMGFVFAVLNATGSTPGTSSIDWVRIAQEI